MVEGEGVESVDLNLLLDLGGLSGVLRIVNVSPQSSKLFIIFTLSVVNFKLKYIPYTVCV